MSLVVNTNSLATRVANNLSNQYEKLRISTQRLSSGLRINSAADDAAGLSIREYMKANIAAFNQGIRNVNDAISLLQTADGALSIIDEKLIRMKELAEQAATGTYDSVQRLMLDSEFQAMGDEIDRIANATTFNGIHLLNGVLSGDHNGSDLSSKGKLKVHFGNGNDCAEDYYYIGITNCQVTSLFPPILTINWPGARIEDGKYIFERKEQIAGSWDNGLDAYLIPSGLKNLTISSQGNYGGAHKPHVNLFSSDGTQLTGYSPEDTNKRSDWWNNKTGAEIVRGAGFSPSANYESKIITKQGESVTYQGLTVTMVTSLSETRDADEIISIEEVTDNLVFLIGGHANDHCNKYDLTITCDVPRPKIDTQDNAQKTLKACAGAIANKDTIRAHIGALQNRLENTVAQISEQAENLKVAESRISDADIATEMTEFVRRKILLQSAQAMLSQANAVPQMALQLLDG